MDVNDILKLDNTMASIKKIDSFLATHERNSNEYALALCKKANILDGLNKPSEAIKLLVLSLPKTKGNDQRIILYSGLIDLNIKNEQFSYALKYINLKNSILDFTNKNYHNLDMIKYYHALNNKLETKRFANIYLNDEVDDTNRVYVLNILADYALSENAYDRYLDIASKLSFFYQKNYEHNELNDIAINKVRIDYFKKNYEEAISEGRLLLKDTSLTDTQIILLTTILINTYIAINDYKRASIIESEYEPYLVKVAKEFALEFAKASSVLYERMNNNFTLEYYKRKINEYEQEIKNKKVVKKTNVVQVDYEEEVKITEEDVVKLESTKYEIIKVSQIYEKLSELLNKINTTSTLLFRDCLRSLGININLVLPIKEIVILYQFDNQFKGYHYKKERVYEKNFTPGGIVDTLPYTVFLSLEEKYVNDLLNSEYEKSIISGTKHEESTHAFAFPLFEKNGVYGAVCFYSEIDFINIDFSYEILKWLSDLLNFRLNLTIMQLYEQKSNERLDFILKNMTEGIKEEFGERVILNDKLAKLIGVDTEIFLDEYLEKIQINDLPLYNECRKNLISGNSTTCEVKYRIKTKDSELIIKERMYLQIDNGSIKIISFILDETQSETKISELKDLVFTNFISKLPSTIKLHVDLNKLLEEKKFAIALIDVNDFQKFNNLYGYSFGNELLYFIGKTLKEKISEYNNLQCYHLDSDKFAVVYENSNDRRSLLSQTNEILDKLSKSLLAFNRRLNLRFSCGVFRYTKNNSESLDEVIYNANLALIRAQKEEKGKNTVIIYESVEFKRHIFEMELITHISEAIDNNSLLVKYQQIVDINTKNVYAYIPSLNLTSFDASEEQIQQVIKEKGLVELMDKHLITKTMAQMKGFYEKTGYYLKVLIPVNQITISETFLEFITTQINFFKIPKETVMLEVKDYTSSKLKILRSIIQEEYLIASSDFTCALVNGATIYLHDLNQYQSNSIEIFVNICINKKKELILFNANNEEDLKIAKENNIRFITGLYFKKKYKLIDLINLVEE